MSNQQNETYYESKKDFEDSNMPQDVDEALDKALPLPTEKQAPGTEAPASATVHAWNADNFGVLFTLRDTDGKNLFVRITNFCKVLKAEGWKSDWKNEPSTTPPATTAQPTTPQATPMCGVHGTPMTWKTGISKKTNKPYAFWSCSTRNADDTYCSYKP